MAGNGGNGTLQTGILVALGVIVAAGVFGVIQSPANATAILGFCGVITVNLLNLFQQKRTTEKLADAADKVECVRENLVISEMKTAAKLAGLSVVADETHALVNSSMGIQLALHAVTARRLAEALPDDQAAAEAAERAETMLRDHEKKQAIADAKAAEGGDAEKEIG